MRSPFVRFALIFILLVAVGLGVFLFLTGRLTPTKTVTYLPPAPKPSPSGPALQPKEMEAPPEISGLNYTEVAIPGADFKAAPLTPGDYVSELEAQKLASPIDGLQKKDLYDSFDDTRGGGKHEAMDIIEPKGTPVHAVIQGNIVKLFNSKKGGLTVYQFDDAQKYCFYYAHLDKYADNIKEAMLVRPGQIIGYVGTSGDAAAAGPHLHLALSLLDPDKKYWKGTPLNPFPLIQKVVAANPS